MRALGELDADRCLEILDDLIRDKGTVVFEHFWDSGGPGAGADSERIYKFAGYFWPCCSTEGFSGPFDELAEALGEMNVVTSATEWIACDAMETQEIVGKLRVVDAPPGHRFEINGEPWAVAANGELTPDPD